MLLALVSLLLPDAFAQTQLTHTPNASPEAEVRQTIGLTDVSVQYFRPAAKDREIWGKLVPYGTVWRAGANDNTIITFSGDVSVEGEKLPAGTYGLHMIPGETETTVIFSSNYSAWGSFSYSPKEDALRVTVPTAKAGKFYEFLTYEVVNHTPNSAVVALNWADKTIGFEVGVDLETSTLASLRRQLQSKAGWSWQGWNEAANYCLANDFNHQEALGWATRSVFMTPTPQNLITKARLAGKLGMKSEKYPDETAGAMASLENDLAGMPCTWKEYLAASNFAVKQEQKEQALAWIDHSIEMSANMTNMMAKADLLENTGEQASAEKVRKEAIGKGSNAELNNYGYRLLFGGKAKEAIAVFEANTKKHPQDPNVWDSLGEGYVRSGEKEKAVKALQKSLSLNPPANVRANSLKLLKQLGVEPTADVKP